MRSMEFELHRPYDLALLAEVSAWIGQTAEALRLLDEAGGVNTPIWGAFLPGGCIGSPANTADAG